MSSTPQGPGSRPGDRSARQAKIDAAAPKPSKAKPILIALVSIVAVLGVVAAVWFGTRGSQTDPAAAAPKGATGATGGIAVTTNAKAGAPTLDVYEDFQCPACMQAEAAVGPTIRKMAADGEAKVVYHMKSFLDANLGNDSSTRAALAASCSADAGRFQQFHDAVFAANTPEGQGYTDAQLETFATQSGVTGDALNTWKSCYSTKKYADYVKGVEETTAKAGVTGTPTFRVNGKDMDLSKVNDAAGFRAAVLAGGAASPTS
ncbi:DsbA family protein [Agilicoccus flavus]|uniref:DsbA family protein n=1 Tax=Agilicoccus flavus TaxID=2775968 RepID=UPI001CF6E259|nr:thioredoxin domain-containing protein [Agilicoccus flavus]